MPVAPTTWPFNASYVTAHELVHLFGAVPDCAPTRTARATSPTTPATSCSRAPDFDDLMLDAGRDDYFGTNATA